MPVALFAYGSLQPGAWNFERLFREPPPTWQAVAWGDVSYAYASPEAYPAARFRDRPALAIFGHLLLVDTLSPEWAVIMRMELGAGYHLVRTPVAPEAYCGDPPAGLAVTEALAFEYDGPPVVPALAVPGGDWLAWHRQMSILYRDTSS